MREGERMTKDITQKIEVDERFSDMLKSKTLYHSATDKELIEALLAQAAGFGLGAAWGVSPLSDMIEEICQRFIATGRVSMRGE